VTGTRLAGRHHDPARFTRRLAESEEGPPMPTETQSRPPLIAGDRLSQPEFHRRYEQMPRNVKARLIDGVVYLDEDRNGMASPTSDRHGDICFRAISWLGFYQLHTEGTRALDNATLILGEEEEAQPDVILAIRPDRGGGTWVEGRYLHGRPEFLAEISVSSLAVDLGSQRIQYERAGIPEYLVLDAKGDEIHWHVLRDGQLAVVPPDADGIYRSRSFPGLWLDPAAFWAEDGAGLIATLERGLASPEYAEFAARLRAVRPPGD